MLLSSSNFVVVVIVCWKIISSFDSLIRSILLSCILSHLLRIAADQPHKFIEGNAIFKCMQNKGKEKTKHFLIHTVTSTLIFFHSFATSLDICLVIFVNGKLYVDRFTFISTLFPFFHIFCFVLFRFSCVCTWNISIWEQFICYCWLYFNCNNKINRALLDQEAHFPLLSGEKKKSATRRRVQTTNAFFVASLFSNRIHKVCK